MQRVAILKGEPRDTPLANSSFGRFEMRTDENLLLPHAAGNAAPNKTEIEQVAKEVCEKALVDAKSHLHPLVRDVELDRLDQRNEFVQAFKSALERRIAKRMATWLPGVQAVFKFEGPGRVNQQPWDGTIHLLVKVPRLSDQIKALAKRLDRGLVACLRQVGWTRFEDSLSILDIQQVTSKEVKYGIGYGAMFCAVYTVPVKVWPRDRHIDQQPRP